MDWLFGIDTKAHLGALNATGRTIAVLGSGLDKVSPEENTQLFNNIVEKGGLVISEYEENVEAKNEFFPIRNRIIAGISKAVLVVEAGYRSGASLTANIAKKQGKKVLCIPCNVDNKYVRTNELIREGAIPISTVDQILDELDIQKIKVVDIKNDYEKTNDKLHNVNPKYKEIYKGISDMPIHINEICKKINKDISEISSILTLLELEGHIEQLPGKMFKLL